jgi:hypothetical protein
MKTERAKAMRERRKKKQAEEHAQYREEMRKKIEKYGGDISRWPEFKSKPVTSGSLDRDFAP